MSRRGQRGASRQAEQAEKKDQQPELVEEQSVQAELVAEADQAQAALETETETETTATPDKDEDPEPELEELSVRVLRDILVEGVAYKPNQVVRFGRVDGKGLVAALDLLKSGAVDKDEAAVKYCLEQEGGVEVIDHAPLQDSAPEQEGDDEGEIVD